MLEVETRDITRTGKPFSGGQRGPKGGNIPLAPQMTTGEPPGVGPTESAPAFRAASTSAHQESRVCMLGPKPCFDLTAGQKSMPLHQTDLQDETKIKLTVKKWEKRNKMQWFGISPPYSHFCWTNSWWALLSKNWFKMGPTLCSQGWPFLGVTMVPHPEATQPRGDQADPQRPQGPKPPGPAPWASPTWPWLCCRSSSAS